VEDFPTAGKIGQFDAITPLPPLSQLPTESMPSTSGPTATTEPDQTGTRERQPDNNCGLFGCRGDDSRNPPGNNVAPTRTREND
jgi:hypothetical protein